VPSHPRRPIAQRTAQAKGVIGISLLAIDCPEYRQSTQEPFWASFFIILLEVRSAVSQHDTTPDCAISESTIFTDLLSGTARSIVNVEQS
jgi:hypothetical protein